MITAVGLSVGCKGPAPHSEQVARQDLAAVTETYRPGRAKPKLPELGTNSGLSDFLTFAMLNDPRVEAAYFEWAASVERITTARSLPDPQLTFQMDIQNVVTSIMPGLMATIPWPGKLRAGADVASAQSQAKQLAFQAAVLESAFSVKRAYYQLNFLAEKIRVSQEMLLLLADLEKIARTQNEVGKVTLQDVLRAQIEQDRLRTEVVNLEDSRAALLARFKAALGLKGQDPAPPVPQRFESTAVDLTSEQVLETALNENKTLKGLEAEVRAAQASIMLARKVGLPDFSLGLMADAKMDPTLYRPLGTVTLPIWRDKIAAQLAEAQANSRTVSARLTAEQIALAVACAEKTYLYREASRNLALLRDQLLPKARQSLQVARSGYLAGRIDFFNLTDAERTLLGFELDRVEASTQRELLLAELSLIIQGMPATGASARSAAPTVRSSGSPNPGTMGGGM
jgi:outer membrane protein, heavy metal efflux system